MATSHIVEPKYIRHLEDSTITNHAASYPEEMREPFIWFARFLREECRKNLDVLVKKMNDLGHKTTAGTYAKIIQGRWCKDSEGNPTPPILALHNFLQQVEDLKERERIAKLAGRIPFIETETYFDIAAYIDIRRAPETICKFGLILGPTGAQKTATFEHYRDVIGEHLVTHLEAPYTPTMTQFVTDLACKYGVGRGSSHHRKVERIHENVTRDHCLIIDNVQRLYKENRGWNQPIFNFLQKLQDEKRCTIILGAVTDFRKTLNETGYFEQFEGRCGGQEEFHVLPEFTPRQDLIQIAEGVGLRPTKETIKLFTELSKKRGRVRILFNSLQKAKRMADNRKEKLTLDHVRAAITRPDPLPEEELAED